MGAMANGPCAGSVTAGASVPGGPEGEHAVLHPAELISKKRDGNPLSDQEISNLVAGVADHSVTDAQIAAFAMAVWFRGMSIAEQRALTLAMRDSGRVLEWPGLEGLVLDKHSTGGVGDLVSLVLGPLVAAAGGYVPMISGRGLGHTGGTLDKLESIPGFATNIGPERFQQQVRDIGVAMIGQTDDLAPADRRVYAVRDVTATVASPPLIVSSILSKKLAEGLDALVMDIKVGSGAFMPTDAQALQLGETLCRVAVDSGLRCNAILTDMNQAIAGSAGNALEVAEAVAYLRGDRRHPGLHELVLELAGELLQLGDIEPDLETAKQRLQQLLDSGAAAERFAMMVRRQGGPADLLEHSRLPSAPFVRPVLAGTPGRIAAMDMRALGLVVVRLGGGRRRADDAIDPAVGLTDLCMLGAEVEADTPLAVIHAATAAGHERAERMVRQAFRIGDRQTAPAQAPRIRARIEGGRLDERKPG
jgi:thymidine phosphorylase